MRRPAAIAAERLATACALALAVGAMAQAPAPDSASAPVPASVRADQLLEQGQTAEAVAEAERAVRADPNDPAAWFVLARARHSAGDLDGAIEAGHRAAAFPQVRASAFYNLACAYALKGDKASAFKALAGAKRAGFADRELMASDPDLTSLRDDARFVLPQMRNFFSVQLSDGTELPYSVDLPIGFDPSRDYPVLIAPGPGRKVEGNWGGLFWGEDTGQRGWISVESSLFLIEDPVGAMSRLLDEVARRYHPQGGKVHVVCYGPTSPAAFAAVMAMPARVHSITAAPGFPVESDDAHLRTLAGVKVMFIVGERDPLFRHESEAVHRRLVELGIESFIEIVPGAGQLLPEMFGGELAERLNLLR